MLATSSRALVRFKHDNALRVFGGPGAGKTRALVDLLTRHVDDGDFELHDGIIVSFTRAAAHGIAQRVNPHGEPGRYHCTLHALCKRYFGIEAEVAEAHIRDFFKERGIEYRGRAVDVDDLMMGQGSDRSAGALLQAFWTLCRNRLMTITSGKGAFPPEPEVTEWWSDDKLEKLYADYEAWKMANGYVDFTNMLEYAVENPPRRRWPFFVMDECQDSTPLQWRVAQAFASCADVVYLAGDDDQAIYQWAGATPYEFLEANVAVDDVLAINHRSGGNLVRAATSLINRNRIRKWKPIEAARPGGQITFAGTDRLPLPRMGEHTFVMARAKYLNEPLVEELERKGFPFVDRSGSGGVNGKASEAFHRFLRLQAGHAISLQEWRLLAKDIPTDKRPWLVRGAKARLDRLEPHFRESTYITIRDLPDYGATETLVAAIGAGEVAVLESLDQRRLGYLKEVERRYGTAYLNEHKAAEICVVGSIHAFKGLECDRAIVNTAMPPRAAASAETDLEAERRVAYVAASRAKEEITYYTGGSVRSWEEIL
jgi:DNA helicase-2/ATP-dependent DNA helicase PcrA